MTFDFVQNSRGESYVQKFLEEQSNDVKDFLLRKLEKIQEYGFMVALRTRAMEKVQNKLYTIRIPYKGCTYRIFCTPDDNNIWLLLHAVMKKDMKLRKKDIKTALSRIPR